MDEHDPDDAELIQFRAEAEALLEIPLVAPKPDLVTVNTGSE
jgi:hypothetical protein